MSGFAHYPSTVLASTVVAKTALQALIVAAVLLLPGSVLLPRSVAVAAVLELMDGSSISGAVVEKGEDSILIIDAEGNHHRIAFSDILGVDWTRGSDEALDERAARERRKIARHKRDRAKKLLKGLAIAKEDKRQVIIAQLEELPDERVEKALGRAVRSSKPAVREYALGRLARIGTPETMIPVTVSSLYVNNREFSQQAHEVAITIHRDVARKVYEYAAVRPQTKHKYRLRALGYLGEMRSRESVPRLLQATAYATQDVRITLLRSKGIREQSVNLGSLTNAATNVDIELPEAELIQVQTSAIIPVEIKQQLENALYRTLSMITGKDFGTDLEAWTAWWKDEGQHASAKPPPASSPAPAGPEE